MPDDIIKPRPPRIILPDDSRLGPQQKIIQRDSGLLVVDFDPDPRPHPDTIKVSAYTDDPNLTRPVTERYFADEFQTLPDGKPGLQGPAVKVDMKVAPKDGALVFAPGADELGATTAYVAARTVKEIAEGFLGRPVKWGDGTQLTVDSFETSSNELNAYYKPTERKVSLGHATSAGYSWYGGGTKFDPNNPSYNLALVPEVVAHECGHAVFDTLKPNTPYSLTHGDADIKSVNEGLADGMAFLHDLAHGEVVQRALVDTGLDLTRRNALSELGDTVGEIFEASSSPENRALRSFRNDKKYEAGKQYECHTGGEIVGGALYDFFLARYQAQREKSWTPRESVFAASETTGTLFLNALKFTPDDGTMSFADYARGLVTADVVLNGGRNLAVLKQVLAGRGLLTPEEVEEAAAKVEQMRGLGLSVPPGYIVDGDVRGVERFYPKLREALDLGDTPLELSRVERDRHGVLRMVFFQPRAGKEAEAGLEKLAERYGQIDRDALLSQGSLTVVFDPRGRLAAVFDDRGSNADVLIDGQRGDGQPPKGGERRLPLSDWDGIEHRDDFGHRVRPAGG